MRTGISICMIVLSASLAQAADVASASFWLRRAGEEIAAEAKERRGEFQFGANFDLVLMGYARLGDRDAIRELMSLCDRMIESTDTAFGRAIMSAGIADIQWKLGEKDLARKWMDRADFEAKQVRNESIRLIAPHLVRAHAVMGEFDVAERMARGETDPVQRAGRFCSLATIARGQGKNAAAAEYLRTALAVADEVRDDDADHVRNDVASVYVEWGDFATAEKVARAMSGPDRRAFLYSTIAEAQRRAGDNDGYASGITKARQEAARITGASERAWQLVLIAMGQVERQDSAGALETLKLARTAIEGIADPRKKAREYLHLAEELAQAGDTAGCLAAIKLAREVRTAGHVTDNGEEPYQMSDIGRALGRAGRVDAALSTLNGINDPFLISEVYWGIVEGCAKAGKIVDAQQYLPRVTEPMPHAMSCRLIGAALGTAKRFDEASAWIAKLQSRSERAAACLGVAEGIMGKRVNERRSMHLFDLGL